MKDGQGPTPGSERWFTFRPLRPHDKQELQALQEEWFPVRYENAFYDNAVLGLSSNGKKSLVSVAAVENTYMTEEDTLRFGTPTSGAGETLDHLFFDASTNRVVRTRLCGVITAQFYPLSATSEEQLLDKWPGGSLSMYILTLGVARSRPGRCEG
jgi:hypothetical protein